MKTSLLKVQNKVTSPFRQSPQSGFSLIELMVAMVISLLIMGAILTLFLDVTRTNDEMAKTNIQIENGRFAIQLLQSDLAHAGFWNGYIPKFDDLAENGIPDDAPTAVPNPCLAYGSWNPAHRTNLLGIPVQAYEQDGIPTECEGLVSSPKSETDVLIVRHVGTCVPGVAGCEADTLGKLYFQASLCEDDLSTYVLDTSGFILHPRTTNPSGLASCADPLSTLSAPKRKFASSIYYIRDFSSTPGDGTPTLMRSQFDLKSGVLEHQPAEALIEGIEGFRVELGVDNLSETGAAVNYAAAINWNDPGARKIPTNRGDGSPDGDFTRCTTASPCDEGDLANVTVVKVYFLVRSLVATPGYTDSKTYNLGTTTLGPFGDNFKRHVFSTTVRLVNISGRRETP
ncbi:prepilin-type N-terminal cleavage/methylation domain-containing protein [Pseudomonas cavernae]|uniref:Prepilin-type N-terminal cleavage/methylation domain-containing protein n=1 Tax=Pseudomonas cavernae TaxID=2320867 RepID=A0A385Z737_9PSED|nr:PilW family protein [Pseudomonas cavernae]AYC34330.1 prepilin-type N-terminal cleavage/methylation domain-containing protein [Pseudomonas cavernae]